MAMKVSLSTLFFNTEEDPEAPIQIAKEEGYDGIELVQNIHSKEWVDAMVASSSRNNLPIIAAWTDFGFENYKHLLNRGIKYLIVIGEPVNMAFNSYINHARELGVQILLHPHVGPNGLDSGEFERWDRCLEFIKRYDIRICADIAHLSIAGYEPCQLILNHHKYIEYYHLKDWVPDHGTGPSFGNGFCELGNGIINIAGVLGVLRHIKYSGWLCVEPDISANPAITAHECRQYLREFGI